MCASGGGGRDAFESVLSGNECVHSGLMCIGCFKAHSLALSKIEAFAAAFCCMNCFCI